MGLNLLLVDDSHTTRMVLKKAINIIQLDIEEIFEADNGFVALEKLKESGDIDLVISDLNMPKMTGIEMIRRIRQDEKLEKTPIIVISSQETEDNLTELSSLSVNCFIRKPFEPIEIKEAISGLLNLDIKKYAKLMYDAIEKVLEKTFFILPEQQSDEEIEDIIYKFDGTEFYYLSLKFEGDINGLTKYYMPIETSKEMIGNLLASEGVDNETEFIEDNLKEFASIVCGNFFSDNFPNKKISFILPPELEKHTFNENIILQDLQKWNALLLEDKYLFYSIKL